MFGYDKNDMESCRRVLKELNFCYSFTSKIYLFAIILTLFMDVYFMIMTPNPLFLFIDILFKCGCFYFGFMKGFTDKNNSGCYCAILLHLVAFIVLGVGASILSEKVNTPGEGLSAYFTQYVSVYNIISLLMTPILFVLTFVNNKYNELSQIKGFPYFNERFEKQKEESKVDKYQEYFDELKEKRSKTDAMELVIEEQTGTIEAKSFEKNTIMSEIDFSYQSNDLSKHHTNTAE